MNEAVYVSDKYCQHTRYCGNRNEKVMYAEGTGEIFVGGSESYEQWRTVSHRFCPHCGTKVIKKGV